MAVAVSQDDKYGLYTSLEDHGAGSISGVYWSLRDDWNSILTVMNAGDEEETVTVELAYNGGTFVLPEFALLPRQSKTLNLRKLVAEGVVDREGNPFPEGADHGGYLVYSSSRPLKAKLVVKEHLVSQRLEVAAPFYQTCNWVQSFFLSDATPITRQMGQTYTVYPQCEMSTGHIYGDSEANLFSTDTSIISVGGTGTSRLVTALAPGVAEVDGDTFEPGDEFCTEYVFLLVAAKQVTVIPGVTISGPNRAALGTDGNQVGLAAQGNPSGGSYSWSANNANVSLSPNGNLVTVTGQSISSNTGYVDIVVQYTVNGVSGSTSHSFKVQRPTSLLKVTTGSVTAPSLCGGGVGCGVTRTFDYQVRDQSGEAIEFSMPYSDAIQTASQNTCNLTQYVTTPPNVVTDGLGRFTETLTICASTCKSGQEQVCLIGQVCTTTANQGWTVNGVSLSGDTKNLTYHCDTVLVNGQ